MGGGVRYSFVFQMRNSLALASSSSLTRRSVMHLATPAATLNEHLSGLQATEVKQLYFKLIKNPLCYPAYFGVQCEHINRLAS